MIPYPYSSLSLVSEDDRHFRFLCCFHKEAQGSLVINKTEPYKGFYKCFACGVYGSAKDFAYRYLGHDKKLIDSQIKEESQVQEIIKPKINWDKFRMTPLEHLPLEEARLALEVGVSVETIRKFHIGWKNYQFLIPMYNEEGLCGISARYYRGNQCSKRCIKGSKHGQFVVPDVSDDYTPKKDQRVFICEGWSDTAVVTELGFYAIGRFNAADLGKNLQHFVWPTYIITDSDECGVVGSKKLQKLIGGKILYPEPGHKDIRDMLLHYGKEQLKKWIEARL